VTHEIQQLLGQQEEQGVKPRFSDKLKSPDLKLALVALIDAVLLAILLA
jgi:hypothetical protein